MISEYDVRKAFRKAKSEGRPLAMYMNEEETELLDSETNERVCSIKTYTEYMREKLHCNFEVVYSEHVSLEVVYRCRQCGAVIFGGDDERYDPNLCCPVCGEYKTFLDYWSKEEIEQDEQKQKTIAWYEEMERQQEIEWDRRERRGGLYDWQLFIKKWFGKKYGLIVELEDYGHPWDGEKPTRPWWWRMINLSFRISKKDGEYSYIRKHTFSLPLTPYAWYIRFRVWTHRRNNESTY